ncbi:MAG TPA: hypothetical protein VE439_05000 [Anaerolineae bacterium]|nr:hypothetical protein [Anaerolineae bacterium]
MAGSKVSELIYELFKEAGTNVLEDRVARYIVNELRAGKKLSEILSDPYVVNRVRREHLIHVLEHKEILVEFEARIKESLNSSARKSGS